MNEEFKDKEFELAPQVGIDAYDDLAQEIVVKCCGISKGALVTDETELTDFDFRITEGDDGKPKVVHETDKALAKIKEIYGIDMSGVENLNLLEICKLISTTRG